MNKLYNDTAVQAIANAIRAKNGSSDTYTIAEMSTALNDLSYYAKPTISNVPLATFEADGLPLNSLKVSVEAKQDLHGYDKPWVGGAGKNKAMPYRTTNDSVVGIPYTVDKVDDNIVSYTLNGTATSSAAFLPFKMPVTDSEKTYNVVYFENPVTQKFAWDTTDNVQITIGDNITIPSNHAVYIGVYIYSGTVISNKKLKVMASESAITTFEPYSNECPISGWSEAKVSDASENIYDSTGTTAQNPTASNVTIINTKSINVKGVGTGTYPASKQLLSEYSLTNGKTYKIRANAIVSSGKPIIAIRASNNSNVISTDTSASGSGILELKFTYDSETMNYISFFSNYGEAHGDVTYSDIMFAEVVSTTIPLPQTVYGAEVDVVNGTSGNKLTSIKAVLDGTENWEISNSTYDYISFSTSSKTSIFSQCETIWNGDTTAITNMIRITNQAGNHCYYATGTDFANDSVGVIYLCLPKTLVSDVESLKSFLASNNFEINIPLRTPTTLTTQPTPIKSLNGINNLSVDSGDVIELEYFKEV